MALIHDTKEFSRNNKDYHNTLMLALKNLADLIKSYYLNKKHYETEKGDLII